MCVWDVTVLLTCLTTPLALSLADCLIIFTLRVRVIQYSDLGNQLALSPFAFSVHWHRFVPTRSVKTTHTHTLTILPAPWLDSYCEIPWINYSAHSFSYLVTSTVMMSTVSGIWDGYFCKVNFPERRSYKSECIMTSSWCKRRKTILMTLWL